MQYHLITICRHRHVRQKSLVSDRDKSFCSFHFYVGPVCEPWGNDFLQEEKVNPMSLSTTGIYFLLVVGKREPVVDSPTICYINILDTTL